MAYRIAMGDFSAFRRGQAAGACGGDDPAGPPHPRAAPAPRHFGVRRTFSDVPAHLSVPWYRMNKASLELLSGRIGHHLLPGNTSNNVIPPEVCTIPNSYILDHLKNHSACDKPPVDIITKVLF